jgi:pyruvate/2-oxoglutarate dehydrogenase complex dihydrolipoamide acyltransferase (E2) component
MTSTHRGVAVKQVLPLNRLQKSMAKAMKLSTNTLALSQVSRELDLSALQPLRTYGLNTLLMASVARTLPAHPLLNAELTEAGVVVFETVNLGMAIALPQGLVVAVLADAGRMEMAQLAARSQDLVERARANQLTLADLEGGTFTVSNLGALGVDSGIPIPRPPESAILLFGAAKPRPVVVEGELAVRPTCHATLSFDHRFIDGAAAAAFVNDLYTLLLHPDSLLNAYDPTNH